MLLLVVFFFLSYRVLAARHSGLISDSSLSQTSGFPSPWSSGSWRERLEFWIEVNYDKQSLRTHIYNIAYAHTLPLSRTCTHKAPTSLFENTHMYAYLMDRHLPPGGHINVLLSADCHICFLFGPVVSHRCLQTLISVTLDTASRQATPGSLAHWTSFLALWEGGGGLSLKPKQGLSGRGDTSKRKGEGQYWLVCRED